ncbi:hypothetical protein [Arthrobacter agilis]|uniref:hypothetical protein n=1 Tax=Arthrobacter agilis TaxID=37921 RepID=UPI0027D8B2B3|nr:hypothetical protein [Arthrobacter agilis]
MRTGRRRPERFGGQLEAHLTRGRPEIECRLGCRDRGAQRIPQPVGVEPVLPGEHRGQRGRIDRDQFPGGTPQIEGGPQHPGRRRPVGHGKGGGLVVATRRDQDLHIAPGGETRRRACGGVRAAHGSAPEQPGTRGEHHGEDRCGPSQARTA